MDIPSDKKYLLEKLGFNIQTTCSVDEAVGIMLGLWNVDCYLDIEMDYQESISSGEYCYSFSLGEYLTEERMALQSAFREAKYEGASEERLCELLEEIEKFDNDYMKKAKIYLCLVKNEIAKGDKSELVFIDGKISLASLDQWLTGEKSPLKPKPKPKSKGENLPKSIFDRIEQNVPKHSSKYDKELILSEQVTFGLLLRAFVTQYIEMQKAIAKAKKVELKEDSTVLNLYHQPDTPNLCKITERLITILKNDLSVKTSGYSDESIRKRLAEVRDALKEHVDNHSVSGHP
jgi:hypothetical protein